MGPNSEQASAGSISSALGAGSPSGGAVTQVELTEFPSAGGLGSRHTLK
jgi:hypothetical protein